MPRLTKPLLLLACLLAPAAAPAGAELVIFADGGFLKVGGVEVVEEQVRLELSTGGAMMVPLGRVARILEDEVVPTAEPEPAVAVAQASFAIAFDPAQTPPETPYADLIYEVAERHGLNPELVAAVARAESAFRPRAVSPKGARGLMQLMPATARRFGLTGEAIFEPARNLDVGARYLRWLSERFDGHLPSVLAAYNAGEGTVDRYRGVPPYRETREYLRRIYGFLELPQAELTVVAALGP